MALYCSCEAELPDHARFCHNCGKPQRQQDEAAGGEIPEAAAWSAPAPPPAPAAPPTINFSNPVAVRVALLCASFTALLNSLPLVNFGCCIWMVGAGFLSAFLYARRTGLALSVGDGARQGGITGLLTFVIGIAFTALIFVLTSSGGGVRDALRQSIEKMPAQDEVSRQLIQFFTAPSGIAIIIMVYLVLGCLVTISLSVAGGALGAKVMEKE